MAEMTNVEIARDHYFVCKDLLNTADAGVERAAEQKEAADKAYFEAHIALMKAMKMEGE